MGPINVIATTARQLTTVDWNFVFGTLSSSTLFNSIFDIGKLLTLKFDSTDVSRARRWKCDGLLQICIFASVCVFFFFGFSQNIEPENLGNVAKKSSNVINVIVSKRLFVLTSIKSRFKGLIFHPIFFQLTHLCMYVCMYVPIEGFDCYHVVIFFLKKNMQIVLIFWYKVEENL